VQHFKIRLKGAEWKKKEGVGKTFFFYEKGTFDAE